MKHASKMRVRGGYRPGLELLEGRWQPGSILSTDLAWSWSLAGVLDLALGDSQAPAPLQVGTVQATTLAGDPALSSAAPIGPEQERIESAPVAAAVAPSAGADLARLAAVTLVEEGGASTDGPSCPLDYTAGFGAPGLTLNGNATVTGGVLRLTDNIKNQVGSAYSTARVPITGFFTFWTMRIYGGGHADGMGFVAQADIRGASALGPAGGGMGYGADNPDVIPPPPDAVRNSVIVKFDPWSNAGEGRNSLGVMSDGRSPSTPRVFGDWLTSLEGTGVDVKSEHLLIGILVYDGFALDITLIDGESGSSVNVVWPVDIAAKVGGTMAHVGFTGATGGVTDFHDVQAFLYCTF